MSKFIVENLTKKYGNKLVLDDVSFELEYGNIIGILGLNGAGKTTLMNCLSGVEGSAENKKYFEKRKDFCYVTKINFYEHGDKIKDVFDFYDNFFEDFDGATARAETQVLGLGEKSFIRDLSLGQRCIFDFIIAMNRDAKVYMFDEPFSNLDINVREYMKKKLIAKIDESKLFLISSHDISELEQIFSSILIIHNNKMSKVFEVEEIREKGLSLSEFYKDYVGEGKEGQKP